MAKTTAGTKSAPRSATRAQPPAATGRSRASQPRSTAPKQGPNDRPRKVRAIRLGYYEHIRRREGDVFVLQNPSTEFSKKWMEYVDARTPERVTTGPQELRKKHDELLGGRVLGEGEPNTGDEAVLGE